MTAVAHRRAALAVLAILAVVGVGSLAAGPAGAADGPTLNSTVEHPGNRLTEFPLPNPSSLPSDMARGHDGTVWVATFGDRRVLHLSEAGVATVTAQLAGGPSSLSPSREADDAVWAAEYASNAIAHISSTGEVTEYPIPTPNSFPAEILDMGDLVYFTESTSGMLGRLTKSTGVIEEFRIAGAGSPWGIAGFGDASPQFWITDPEAQTIWIVGPTGMVLDYIPGAGPVRDVSINPQWDTVTATVASDTEIDEYVRSPKGVVKQVLVSGRTAIGSMAVVSSGGVWFTDSATDSLVVRQPESADISEFTMPMAGAGLTGITLANQQDEVWAAERSSGKVVRMHRGAAAVVTQRFGGADRYEVAATAAMARAAHSQTVFVVSGEKFADALSVGAISAQNGGGLLLVAKTTLPDATARALVALTPRRVIVVGGVDSVSDAVLARIGTTVPGIPVSRIGGADRYAVSRNVIAANLTSAALSMVILADGRNYPDALSSTPIAALQKGAVLLVDGSSAALSAEELAIVDVPALARSTYIAGGTASVSQSIQDQLSSFADVRRFDGADRYDVSVYLNYWFFGDTPTATMASGSVFSDALAGGAVAGAAGQPILLVRPNCIPANAIGLLTHLSTERVVLFGGPATLDADAENLQQCM